MVDFSNQKFENRALRGGGRTAVSELARWTLVGGFFVALFLAYAWSQNEILSIRYQIEEIKGQNAAMAEENKALKAQYHFMVSPQRIESSARKVGLISSNDRAVLILEADAVTPALPANLLADSRAGNETLRE
ncbi:MAG TPA: septum formation initiator family protein [Acidobacteriota bacterium]|nr:septum formation initiator family protein [Acidobacteriota bacterium]